MFDIPGREIAEMSAMNQNSQYDLLTRWEKDREIHANMPSVKGRKAAVAFFNLFNKIITDERARVKTL